MSFTITSGSLRESIARASILSKAREVVATEDAKLHLMWHYNKIYIKPMPLCLLRLPTVGRAPEYRASLEVGNEYPSGVA
jgi:hypothetical protein